MTAIQFYHLTATPLERALPKLLEKAYGAGMRALVVAESDERVEQLNQLLWTYDPASFLPHASAKEGNGKDQPILLSQEVSDENSARLLAITDGRMVENPASFERILDIFDGTNPQSTENARSRWKSYMEQGLPLTYYRQTETGGWAQK